MGFWKSLAGVYTLEITSASPSDMLKAVSDLGITLFDITYVDDLRVRGNIYKFDFEAVKSCLLKRGETHRIVRKKGIYWSAASLVRRPILVTGLAVFFFMVLFLPTRVLFVRVEGNEKIPAKLIIEKADICGIGFGASRREVRSEKMKNALLSAIPELQWAGVNTSGCVAVISVQERSTVDKDSPKHGVSSIVAARDGIIRNLTVLQGNALCKVGQAVKRGQVLVSGYTDCGIVIKGEVADAEITAQTLRYLTAAAPASYEERVNVLKQEMQYYIRIGKNIINLCKDSGISDASCVKMYEETYLTLPGGFQLPVSLITEQLVYYDSEIKTSLPDENADWLKDAADAYLRGEMLAGEILDSHTDVYLQEDVYRFAGYYSCLEMIGQVRSEEIVQGNGKRD